MQKACCFCISVVLLCRKMNIFAILDLGYVFNRDVLINPLFLSQVRTMCATLWDVVAMTASTMLLWSYR